jgi:hypothetical protein
VGKIWLKRLKKGLVSEKLYISRTTEDILKQTISGKFLACTVLKSEDGPHETLNSLCGSHIIFAHPYIRTLFHLRVDNMYNTIQ